MTDSPERVAYFNGAIVAESNVLIPLRDAGFLYGWEFTVNQTTWDDEPNDVEYETLMQWVTVVVGQ